MLLWPVMCGFRTCRPGGNGLLRPTAPTLVAFLIGTSVRRVLLQLTWVHSALLVSTLPLLPLPFSGVGTEQSMLNLAPFGSAVPCRS